jgi:ATP-dependent DNA ligase
VVCLDAKGVPDFDALHSRIADEDAMACAFDILAAGDDMRGQPLIERKKVLRWILRNSGYGIQYVHHNEGDGNEMFESVCKLGLEGIVSKKLTSVYKSGPSKAWLKVKNSKAPAATRAIDCTF